MRTLYVVHDQQAQTLHASYQIPKKGQSFTTATSTYDIKERLTKRLSQLGFTIKTITIFGKTI